MFHHEVVGPASIWIVEQDLQAAVELVLSLRVRPGHGHNHRLIGLQL